MLEDLTPDEEENAVTLFFDGYDTVLDITMQCCILTSVYYVITI